MKIKETISKGILKSKDLYAAHKEKRLNAVNPEIVDHLAKARAEEDKEKDIYTKITEAKIMTQKQFWGDATRPIDLMATWGHARFHSVANLIVSQMPSQPIRLVKGLLLTTSACALILGSSTVVNRMVGTRDSNLQSYLHHTFGTDLTTATTLSEGKQAHAKWGMFANNLYAKTGQVKMEDFAKSVQDTLNESSANVVDPRAPTLDTSFWSDQLEEEPEADKPAIKSLKIASADGFWNDVNSVALLDESGVLVSSEGNTDKVAAIYQNGQLSINVLDGGNCFHVMGSMLDKSCVETDLRSVELPFEAQTLLKMFDVKNYTNTKSDIVDQATGQVADARWYLGVPDVSKIQTSYSFEDFNSVVNFAFNNQKNPYDTSVWKQAANASVTPLKADITGLFKNPNLISQIAKTPVVAVDGDNLVVAGVVDNELQARAIFGDTCVVLFGAEVNDCRYGRVNAYEADLKKLYAEPSNTELSDLAFYTKANLKGKAKHSDPGLYMDLVTKFKNDFAEHGLKADSWDRINRSKAKVERRKAEGILLEDNSERIQKTDVVVLANPDKPDTIGLMTNISGNLQLDVVTMTNMGSDCFNIFGQDTYICKSIDLSRNDNVKTFVENLF